MSLSSESCSNNLIKPEMGIMANFDSYSFGQKYRGELGLSTDGVWNLSTKKKERKKKYKLAQHESGEPTFIWGKMRTVAQKTESQIALRKVEGKVNIFDFAEGQFHAIKHVFIGFLLIMMSWCHREGIHCFSTYEERQGLSSQNQFLKISNYPDLSHQLSWSTEWKPHFCSQPWTPFRACQRLRAAAAQDVVPAETDGKRPWQAPVCSWKTQGEGHWNFWYRLVIDQKHRR